MERLTQRDLRDLLEFLRESHALRNLDAFPAWVIQALPKVVPSEITSYNEVNPRKRQVVWMSNPDIDSPGAKQLFERHISEHPLITHHGRTRDGRAFKFSDFLTRSQFHRLGLYNEFYRRLSVEHQMAIILPAPPPLVIGIALNRGRRDFSERDRRLLNLLRPHLVQAHRNAEAVTRMLQELTLMGHVMEKLEHGVALLTPERRVRCITDRARQWIAEYFGGPSQPADRLPELLDRWVRHQEALLAREDDVPPPGEPLVLEREGKRLVVRLLRDSEQRLLLLEERQTAIRPESLESLGLTRREAEVLAWVAQGKTNPEVGTILGLSPRTVEKHLERIFVKLGVETRTAAAVRAQEFLGGHSLAAA